MKGKGKFGSDLLLWTIVAAVALYLFGTDIAPTWATPTPTRQTDKEQRCLPCLPRCRCVSVFVPDSVIHVGLNVRLLDARLVFVRDSFDPETVRVVGGIFSIVNK